MQLEGDTELRELARVSVPVAIKPGTEERRYTFERTVQCRRRTHRHRKIRAFEKCSRKRPGDNLSSGPLIGRKDFINESLPFSAAFKRMQLQYKITATRKRHLGEFRQDRCIDFFS